MVRDPLTIMDRVNLYALAVKEENAGGRVVTAPTNGAAGITPAVLHYYARFCPGADEEGVVRFLLTAGAIGLLFKVNASIRSLPDRSGPWIQDLDIEGGEIPGVAGRHDEVVGGGRSGDQRVGSLPGPSGATRPCAQPRRP